MRWTERQQAMLAEMGVQLWLPPADLAADPARAEVAMAPACVSSPVGEPERHEVMAAVTAVAVKAVLVHTAAPAFAAQAPTGVATMDWPALREVVAGCTACALSQGRRQTVFGVGNERAHWMVVGEAPGEQEDIQGEPFVGKSGQLLDNMLRAIGLSRADPHNAPGTLTAPVDGAACQVYIANSVKCRPPGNRNPAPQELAQCEAYLIRQVQLVQPKIILAMGRFAVQSLLRSAEPIGKLRGRVHDYQGVPLIVTYHPAYLLRNLEEKAKAWDDLCLAVETMRECAPA